MLGVAGVFDSRSTGFADDVLAATGGEGVDVVLNSLSGELMKQSLRLLRPFGRFLEIGKRDLYRNTPVGIRPLRHNASYFAIDADELVAQRPVAGRRAERRSRSLLEPGACGPCRIALWLQRRGRRVPPDAVVRPHRQDRAAGRADRAGADPGQRFAVAGPDGVYRRSRGRLVPAFGLEARALAGPAGRPPAGAAQPPRCGGARSGGGALADFAARGRRCTRLCLRRRRDVCAGSATLDTIRRPQMPPLRGVIHAAMVLDDAFMAKLDAVALRRRDPAQDGRRRGARPADPRRPD